MNMQSRITTALATICLALAVVASSAGAVTISVSPAGTVSSTSSSTTFEGSGVSIVCPLTLTYSLLRGPITIAEGNQVGEVTAVRIGSCTGGSVETVLALPWRKSIHQSLPEAATPTNLTGLLYNIARFGISFTIFGGFVNCLYQGTIGQLMAFTHTSGGSSTYTARTLTSLSTTNIPLSSGGFGCPSTLHSFGNFTLGTTQTITAA